MITTAQHTIVLKSHSAEETASYGHILAQTLGSENVILLLYGDLGAGKTTFVRGLVDGFGGVDNVGSPSFNLLNIYRSPRYMICHIDAYRDEDVSWEDLMLDDILDSPFCCAIEWPEHFHDLPDYPVIQLKFEMFQNTRSLTLSTRYPQMTRVLDILDSTNI